MRTAVRTCIALAVFLSMTVVASAQQRHHSPTIGGFGDFGLISTVLEADRAHEKGIGSWGGGLLMGGGIHLKGIVLAGAQVNGQFTKDRDPFWNDTNVGEMKSTAMFFDASAFVGLQTPAFRVSPTREMRLGLNCGESWPIAKRGITNCSNCDSESMRIRKSPYFEPSVSIGKAVISTRIYTKKADMRFSVLLILRGMSGH